MKSQTKLQDRQKPKRSRRAPKAGNLDESPVAVQPTGAAQETILLAVTGMSPAILTETLWALANPTDGSEPVVPHRVIVVTTTSGRQKLAQLLEPSRQLGGATPWDALRKALADRGHDLTGRLRFGTTPNDIRVITATDPYTGRSAELPDIRNRADNEAAADFILEQVRAVVENPDTQLIVSIAGGRKTMSALLYACMTLLGRETDRLTHVLVSEPYDVLQDFWFPAQPGGPILLGTRHLKFGQKVKTLPKSALNPADAIVDLADVPFVPLRNLFRRELGQPAGTFRRLIELSRTNVRIGVGERLRLEIETNRPQSLVNGRPLSLSPREHLVLLFFAYRAKRGETVLSAYDEALVDLEDARKQLRSSAPPNDWSDWRSSPTLDRPFTERDLTRALSDIRAKAKRAGGDAAFLADVLPQKGRCSLDIPGPMIHIK